MEGLFYIKRLVILALVILTLFGVSGCKGGDGTIQSGELVVVEDTSDINLAIYNIDTLNPIKTRSESVQKIMNIVYEPLFRLNDKKEPENVIANGYVMSADGKRITVTLGRDVKWHDGTNLTSEDVVYTISQIKSSSGFYQKAQNSIVSYTAPNAYQVIIDFAEPEPNLSYYLTFPIIRSGSVIEGEEFIPMGTGAYRFASKGGTEIILEPNKIWHKETISKKKIIVNIFKDKAAASEAFGVGKIDAVTSFDIEDDAIKTKEGSKVNNVITDKMVFVGFNTQSSILSSSDLRVAIANILDKQKLLETGEYGHGKVADLAINPDSWAHISREVKTDAKYTAKKLIEGNGYRLSNGIYYKSNEPLTVRILVNADNQRRANLADLISASLGAEGFQVVIDKVSYEEYLSKVDQKSFDIFIGEVLVDPNLNPMTMLSGSENYFGFDISELSAVSKELIGAVGKEDYKKIIEKVMDKFYENPPYVPLYFKSESVIYGSYVSGIEVPGPNDSYRGIEKWYFYEKDGKQEE